MDLETTLAAEGTIIVKFWMHLSPEEQLRRFESRRADPYRAWKLTDEDWRNREKRPGYEAAVEDMLELTDHPAGRWYVVAAETSGRRGRPWSARCATRIEKALAALGVDAGPPLTTG